MHMDTEYAPLILQAVHFPGGKVSFVAEMNFLPDSMKERYTAARRTILRNSLQTSGTANLR